MIAAMVHKYVLAAERGDPEVVLWGTGKPSREFLYVDDAARALILCAERLDVSDPVNIGTGKETTIRELAETISELAGFEGKTVWDDSRPDGQPKRYLDTSRARELIGFEAETPLAEGLKKTIESFRAADLATAGARPDPARWRRTLPRPRGGDHLVHALPAAGRVAGAVRGRAAAPLPR